MLVWTRGYKYVFESQLLAFGGIHPKAESLVHDGPIFNFLRNHPTFAPLAAAFSFQPAVHKAVSPHPRQRLVSSLFFLFTVSILMGVPWF